MHTQSYFLIDGENIDGQIKAMTGEKPGPSNRPNWTRVLKWVISIWTDDEMRNPFFYINCTHTNAPEGFIDYLSRAGYRAVLLRSRNPTVKVVDDGIKKTLRAIHSLGGNVVLASHDGDFLQELTDLARDPQRRIALVGFPGQFNLGLMRLAETSPNVRIFDLEADVGGFETPLVRRNVVVDVEDFDPVALLTGTSSVEARPR